MQCDACCAEVVIDRTNSFATNSQTKFENLIQCEVCKKVVVSRQMINNKLTCNACYMPIQKAYLKLES